MRTIEPAVSERSCARAFPAVAERDEQMTVAGQRKAAADLIGARTRTAFEDGFNIGERVVDLVEFGAQDADGRGSLAALEIGEIDEPVVLELGIHRDVEQAAMPNIEHVRRVLDGDGVGVGSDVLEPPGPLGHQEGAVRQPRERPRHLERAGDPDRGEIAFGKHDARLFVRPGGPGLGRRAGERRTGQCRPGKDRKGK